MSAVVIQSLSGGGTSMDIALKNKITNAKITYNKLWSSDTGRSVTGAMTGTLIGLFPTITIEFGRLSDTSAQKLAKIANAASQSLTYYDVEKGTTKTISTYADDYVDEIVNASQSRRHEKVTINFIANNKRSA